MHPPRHALGTLLLEQNHIAEAEQIYRADLGLDNTLNRPLQHPENVWSLHGYVECLTRQHKHQEAAAMQLRLNLCLLLSKEQIREVRIASISSPTRPFRGGWVTNFSDLMFG